MKFWEHFTLVSGYLPELDELPETAQQLGLLRRVAIVLNHDDVPHSQLYWDLLAALVKTLRADKVWFELDTFPGESISFESVSAMRQYVDACPEVSAPFDRAMLYLGGRAHVFIHVEKWAMAGGPFPYSDSWTFAIYRDTDDVARLRDACYRVCTKYGLPIEEEIAGLSAPEQAPRWKRMLRWLLRW